jgi:nucleoid-associated protein YgaU
VVPPASPVAATPSPTEIIYTVQPGDTLQTIAGQVYGDPDAWSRIYEANRDRIGPDPDALRAGMRLELPPG